MAQEVSITCVPGFGVSCAEDIVIDTDAPFVFISEGGGGEGSSFCGSLVSSNVTVSGPTITGNENCPGATYTYTFKVSAQFQECTLTDECTQTFTLVDNGGIFITSCPQPKTVNCAFAAIPEPHLVMAESSCGLSKEISVSGPEVFGATNCPGTQYVYTYTATDECGRAVSCQQSFSIQNDGPELICPPGYCQIECNTSADEIWEAFNWYAENAIVSTSCTGLETEIFNDFNPNGFTQVDCNNNAFAIPNVKAFQYVTFTAVDPCGRISSCTRPVFQIDNDGPTIEGNPYLTIRECDDLSQQEYDAWIQDNITNAMTASDVCGEVNWTWTPASPNEGPWINGYAITEVFFTATDACNNSTTKEAHFKLKNNFPPSWTNTLEDKTIECDVPTLPFDTPTYSHACGETVLTHNDETILGDCPNQYSVTRTWTVTDGCGKSNNIAQTINVNDTTAPVAPSAPADVNVQCASDLPSPIELTATDNCDVAIKATPTSEITPGACANSFTMVRTWTFTDACGNASSVSQTLVVNDDTAPVAPSAPADVNVQCASDLPSPIELTATDNCDVAIKATPTSEITPGACENSFTMVRTWTFTDACGNASSVSQTLVVNDDTAPVAPSAPADVAIQCASDLPAAIDLTAIDNCDGSITVSPTSEVSQGDCANNFTMVRTWTFTDDCGNTSSVSQTLVVNDDTAPIAPSAPEDIAVQCASDVPVAVDLTAIDNCDGSITVSPTSEVNPGDCANSFTMIRTWTFTDDCGNTSSVSQTLIVNDDTAPVAPSAPADVAIQCASDLPAAIDLTAIDNCDGSITVSPTSEVSQGDCANNFTMVRTWTFTDDCGNVSSVSQTLVVNDDTAPENPPAPADLTIQCTDNLPSAVDLTAIDNCDGEITVSPTSEIVPGNCENNYSMVRTWTFADNCGNVSSVSQIIQVVDDTAPVFTYVPAILDVDCDEVPEDFEAPTVTDNCGGVTLTYEDYNSPGSICEDGFAMKRLWTATDLCGNIATVETVIWVNPDHKAPVFTFIPENVENIECNAIPDFVEPIAVDGCSEVTLTYVETNDDPDVCQDNGYGIYRTWTATDACGNSSTIKTLLWIEEDYREPDFISFPEDQVITCDAFPPINLEEPTAIDNCSEVEITYYTEYGTGSEDSCNKGEGFDYHIVWMATDACGNVQTKIQNIWVDPYLEASLGMVNGHIANEADEMIENVEVMISGSNTWSENEMTTEEGYFEFDVNIDNNYTVTPSRNDDPLNGISTMDLILISQHILGINSLNSPYKMIAADVNNSGTITAYDMVALRKLILLIDTEFESNSSWRFVDAQHIFADPTNPFGSTFPEIYSINGLSSNETADFIGIKTGDVNGSAIPNQLVSGDTREEPNDLVLEVRDQNVTEGETYIVDFKTKDFTAILGYQFSLNFNSEQLEFVEIIPGVLTDLNNFGFGLLNEGVITSSWNDRSGTYLEDDATLFSIKFQAKTAGQLKEALQVSSNYTRAEAYSELEGKMRVALEFKSDKGAEKDVFALYQNQPNPFRSETTIGFYLPKSEHAILSVYDLSGKVLTTIEGDYEAGYNEMIINSVDLNGANVLYYRLAISDRNKIKKMVMIRD